MKRLFVAALAGLLALQPALADTLIDNVNGLTPGDDGRMVRFEAMLIDDDGRVAKLFGVRDKRPRAVEFRYDGKGRVLMPSFVDAHGHVMELGFSSMTLDLSGTRSLAEAQEAIRAYAARNPGRGWIMGGGWNQESWGLGRFPTAADIDAVVADRPVYLNRIDGHAVWVNSAAMTAAGVDGATTAPAGGSIEMAAGRPSGVFVDKAQDMFTAAIGQPRPGESDAAFRAAQNILLENGVTTATDMGTTIRDWQTFRRAGDVGALKMRILSYAAGIDDMILIGGPGPTPWLYKDRLRMNGVKLYLDGALGSRGAWLKAPYADRPDASGLELLTPTQLKNKMVRAAMDGFQTAVHAIGDRANDEAIGAIEELDDTFTGDRRWRIEHVQILDPADLPRLAAVGAVASVQPVHQTSDRLMAEKRLGPDRLLGAYAWGSLAKSGARLAFGTDFPVERPDPFAGLAAAITREDAAGEPFGGWQPGEKMGREAALEAYTAGAAYAGMADDRIGRLTPGRYADFVLLDTDPLLAAPDAIRRTKVLETWVAGRQVYGSASSLR